MSTGRDSDDGATSVAALLARVAAAQARADRRLAASITDFRTPDEARLTDRERATLTALLSTMVATVEDDLRRQFARAAPDAANAPSVVDRLIEGGTLHDPALMRELIARVRLDLLADTIPIASTDEPDAPGLLTRLAASADGAVANAALALMTANARRRGFLDDSKLRATELPSELHHHLVWTVAAAIRAQTGPDVDQALTGAALHNLSRYDESDRVEAAAMHLAVAIDARPDEYATLLIRAVGERHLAFVVALLAVMLRFDFVAARDLVAGRDAALWLALRAIDLDRPTVARLGLSLARDVEAFADELDTVMAVDPATARAALAWYALHPDLRAALSRIEAAR